MSVMRLAPHAYRTLQMIIQSSPYAREVRRAQVLVWLHEGETMQSIARRLRLSRQSIYDIVRRYQLRAPLPVVERICDRPHPERPASRKERRHYQAWKEGDVK